MDIPAYLLRRPAFSIPDALRQEIDALVADWQSAGHRQEPVISVAYRFPVPKWQFLCYLADSHGLAFHGSGNVQLDLLHPRQPTDLNAFGAQNAVYAAADGIWPLYYAILDRESIAMTLHNACVRFEQADGSIGDPYYFFSISYQALRLRPWRSEGYVYILPRDTFVQDPMQQMAGYRFRIPMLARFTPVRPLARIAVTADDFPYLEAIRGHDDTALRECVASDPEGFPWLEAERSV